MPKLNLKGADVSHPVSRLERWSKAVDEVLRYDVMEREGEPEIARDVFAILDGFRLQLVRRYFHHRHWESESIEAEFADRAEPGLKLENVAAHSWHVADAVLILADQFAWLDLDRSLALAIVHDKLEMYAGDANPVGRDGLGTKTHAFNSQARMVKDDRERHALMRFASQLRPAAAQRQLQLLTEVIEGKTEESRFVKAVDKLQALAFVYVKKQGKLTNRHLEFTLRYSGKCTEYFPPLARHYRLLRRLLLFSVSQQRGVEVEHVERRLFGQYELNFGDLD